jgi:protein-tyrosine phosphatase
MGRHCGASARKTLALVKRLAMREILPSRLWLGNAADARNVERVIQAGILAVVDLAAEEKAPELPRGLIYCRFPIMDGPQTSQSLLPTAVETLVSLLKRGTPTLVFCGVGMSRSPAVAAAALSIVEGGSPDDRLREIALGHPHDVSPQLWQAVRETCAEMMRRTHP